MVKSYLNVFSFDFSRFRNVIVIEGAKLFSLNGSAYFLISGLIMLAGAVLLLLRLASGATLVVVNALFTII